METIEVDCGLDGKSVAEGLRITTRGARRHGCGMTRWAWGMLRVAFTVLLVLMPADLVFAAVTRGPQAALADLSSVWLLLTGLVVYLYWELLAIPLVTPLLTWSLRSEQGGTEQARFTAKGGRFTAGDKGLILDWTAIDEVVTDKRARVLPHGDKGEMIPLDAFGSDPGPAVSQLRAWHGAARGTA